jgi:hypothetical protein
MVVGVRRACATLLVVPHMTAPPLGLMVLRRGAAMPIPDEQQNTHVFLTAPPTRLYAQRRSKAHRGPLGQRKPSRNRQLSRKA